MPFLLPSVCDSPRCSGVRRHICPERGSAMPSRRGSPRAPPAASPPVIASVVPPLPPPRAAVPASYPAAGREGGYWIEVQGKVLHLASSGPCTWRLCCSRAPWAPSLTPKAGCSLPCCPICVKQATECSQSRRFCPHKARSSHQQRCQWRLAPGLFSIHAGRR